MSKFTKPNTEQSVTCGFYNNDPKYEKPRKYDAMQMSRIFDGVINDGIFKTIGECFVVRANSGNTVNVGPGKAWFNHTWTENDAILPVDCGDSEQLLDRIDALVIDVDARPEVADNTITVVKGTPSSHPNRPVLLNEDDHHQHALCYIYRKAESNTIRDSDITNVIGTSETPYITGILEVTSRDDWFAQWRAELDEFIEYEKNKALTDLNEFVSTNQTEFDTLYAETKRHMNDVVTETDAWSESHKATMLDWFANMQNQITQDAAMNLQLQLDRNEIEKILLYGFTDGVKTFYEDGLVVTRDSLGRHLFKQFSNDSLKCDIWLTDTNGTELGRITRTFSPDGNTISSDATILHQTSQDVANLLSSVTDVLTETLTLQNEYLD
jgi:hypothetical protein